MKVSDTDGNKFYYVAVSLQIFSVFCQASAICKIVDQSKHTKLPRDIIYVLNGSKLNTKYDFCGNAKYAPRPHNYLERYGDNWLT